MCHGDQGQGIGWRVTLEPEDQNCWQSKCHAPNHPPDGFVFPTQVAGVVGPQMAAMFANAQQLHAFIKAAMPYQAPGSLSDEEYWQLTAFLLRSNGIDPGSEPLDEQSAARISLRSTPAPAPASRPAAFIWPYGVFILLVAAGGILLLAARVRSARRP